MELLDSAGDLYCGYIFNLSPNIDVSILDCIETIVVETNWLNPVSAQDWNNIAVIHLIRAEQADDLEERSRNLQIAMEFLEKGFSVGQNPLCAAHYSLVNRMIGQMSGATTLAFSTMINTVQIAYTATERIKTGLIYLPSRVKHAQELEMILMAEDGYNQALMILAEALWWSQIVFYNSKGMRLLGIGHELFPNSPNINLMLGISRILSSADEGILNLNQAHQLYQSDSSALQALYLGCRSIGDTKTANYWLEKACDLCVAANQEGIEWEWTKLGTDSSITYVPFEEKLLMAVEADFRSIVTCILVAQRDWFEDEMEFWRNWLKPGMTVIDVGANVGVYTFSAANKVGSQGLVIAIEPFSRCTELLQETCRINSFTNIRVITAAASDRNGIVKLAINHSSELNQIISDEEIANIDAFEEVKSITLDGLLEQEALQSVDFLKIDAEGHEIHVLSGSENILSKYSPIVMYENVAGGQQTDSMKVADFLRARDYQLFRYQPYLQKLIPIVDQSDMQSCLNIIAIPNKL